MLRFQAINIVRRWRLLRLCKLSCLLDIHVLPSINGDPWFEGLCYCKWRDSTNPLPIWTP